MDQAQETVPRMGYALSDLTSTHYNSEVIIIIIIIIKIKIKWPSKW